MSNIYEEIKEKAEITQEIERLTGQHIRGTGNTRTLDECPFCNHKGCFRVTIDKQRFACYSSSCGEYGDVIDFIKSYERHENKWSAVESLAKAIGFTIKKSNGAYSSAQKESKTEQIFNDAADFYHHILLKDEKAIAELARKRKYTLNEIKLFKIGYSGNKWNNLLERMPKEKYTTADLMNAGLIVDRGKNGESKLGDYFTPQRFIYPAFIGRQVVDFEGKDAFRDERSDDDKNKVPKSINLKLEYRLRNKLFYNQRAFSEDEIIFVEGKDDAIQMLRGQGCADGKYNFDETNWRAPNIRMNVAAFDGNLSDEQRRYIKSKCAGKKVFICADLDDAGLNYTREVFDLIWGSAKQLQVMQLDKLNGSDPDRHFVRAAPEFGKAFKRLKDNSIDAFEYLMKTAVNKYADNAKQINELEPYLAKLISASDQTLVDIALEAVKARFSEEGSSIARIVVDRVKRGRQAKDLTSYQQQLPVWEEAGEYKFKDARGNIQRMSNFVIILEDRIFHEDVFKYKCTLLNSNGHRIEEVMFDGKQRSNINAFKQILNDTGPYYFYGGPNELTYLWEFVDRNQTSEKTIYIQGVGWIKKQNMFLFGDGAIRNNKPYPANEAGVINIDGTNYKPFGVHVYGGELPMLNFEDEYTPEFAATVGKMFNDLVGVSKGGKPDYKGLLFLGFLPAILYSHHIVSALKFFPFPFWYGTAGTGKTVALELFMNCFGYSGIAEPFASQTSAGFCQGMEQVSSLPYWTNEFDHVVFDKLEETFKSAYNRMPPGKGGLNKKRLNYIINGCNIIDGNQLPIESQAMMERIVTFSLFRKPSAKGKRVDAYNWLQANKTKLSVLARQLLIDQTGDTVSEYLKRIGEYRRFLAEEKRNDLRAANNYAIPAAGLHLLRGVQIPADFREWLAEFIEGNREYNIKGDPVINFFQRIRYLYVEKSMMRSGISFDNFFSNGNEHREGNFLYINLNTAFLEIQEDMGRKRENVTYTKNYIFDALKNDDAYLAHNVNRRINCKQTKCMVMDIGLLNPLIQSELNIIKDDYYEKFEEDAQKNPMQALKDADKNDLGKMDSDVPF